ncbi:hypothetical protein AVEN_57231-1 [Araneus ventricosus]|uniref:Uncharacterized protein n=1 Tax=Araneus ventricosus TaxID=182803 RepID=A0A4Y2C3S7_ARAVE|nr:hypothetical protein AVEN_57231-1 [Araneus ventricosus]
MIFRAEPACDSRLHFVVTGEMLPGQEPFYVLEQMVVARSKIGTIGDMVIPCPAPLELLQQLLRHGSARGRDVVEQRFLF